MPSATPFHVLFVCTMNIHRSRTAHDLFEQLQPDWVVSSAGTSPAAQRPLSLEIFETVQQIVCMEEDHRSSILKRFPELKVRLRQQHANALPLRLTTLSIPDIYNHGDPHLQKLLHMKHAQGLIGPL